MPLLHREFQLIVLHCFIMKRFLFREKKWEEKKWKKHRDPTPRHTESGDFANTGRTAMAGGCGGWRWGKGGWGDGLGG